jgi:hypothetical protein
VQDSHQIFRKILLSIKFDRDAPEAKIENPSAASALVAERCVRVSASH